MWFRNLLGWVLGLCILVPLGLYIIYWIFVGVGKFIKFIFSPITNYIKARNEISRQKKEEEKEEEYQAALAKGDKYAKISKDAYFLHKIEKERKAEQKKIQAKIDKYGSNISDEEAERLDRIKKQKAEYDALPQEEKDRLKKKRKRDRIIIIVSLLSPYIFAGLIRLVITIVGMFR